MDKQSTAARRAERIEKSTNAIDKQSNNKKQKKFPLEDYAAVIWPALFISVFIYALVSGMISPTEAFLGVVILGVVMYNLPK